MKISIVVPCRNEWDHIGTFLDCLLRLTLPEGSEREVLVADGMSDDGTREVLEQYQARYREIRVVDNVGQIASTGLNAAIREARGDIIIRMDVHTTYAEDYIVESVRLLQRSGADNVGGPWVPVGSGYVGQAVALAFSSLFVSGGGRAHCPTYEGRVDTVYLGCWRKEAFEKYGLFDQDLVRSQDNELNLRINRAGGTVLQSPKIRSWYTPRPSLKQLFCQYMQYGYWKVRVIQKHKIPASIRQLVPGLFLGSLGLLVLFSPFFESARQLLTVLLGTYALVMVVAAFAACRKVCHLRFLPIMPFVFGTYHFGFGYGFLRGVLDFMILSKNGDRRLAVLTRRSRVRAPS